MHTRIGCSGWSYDDWRGVFYASDAESSNYLEAYARVFRFVEIDGTFYKPPSLADSQRWARLTPPGFQFSPKLPRVITHDAKLRGVPGLVKEFVDGLAPLRAQKKLGPVVLQLPPSFQREPDALALEGFLQSWPRDIRLAVELRHASWWHEETYRALRDAGAALCWSLNEYGRTPPVVTADFVYARLIGDRALDADGGRWGRVRREMGHEIQRLRDELAQERGIGMDAFVVANNHFMGFAPASAQLIAKALGEPPFDLARASRSSGQKGLLDF